MPSTTNSVVEPGVQALDIDGTNMAVKKKKKTDFIVNMVNPKFHNYDKPLCLALTVALFTIALVIIMAGVLVAQPPKDIPIDAVPGTNQSTTVCTEHRSYPQFIGHHEMQRALVNKLTQLPPPQNVPENAVVTLTPTICIDTAYVTLSGHSNWGFSFWNNGPTAGAATSRPSQDLTGTIDMSLSGNQPLTGIKISNVPIGPSFMEVCYPPPAYLEGKMPDKYTNLLNGISTGTAAPSWGTFVATPYIIGLCNPAEYKVKLSNYTIFKGVNKIEMLKTGDNLEYQRIQCPAYCTSHSFSTC